MLRIKRWLDREAQLNANENGIKKLNQRDTKLYLENKTVTIGEYVLR